MPVSVTRGPTSTRRSSRSTLPANNNIKAAQRACASARVPRRPRHWFMSGLGKCARRGVPLLRPPAAVSAAAGTRRGTSRTRQPACDMASRAAGRAGPEQPRTLEAGLLAWEAPGEQAGD